MNAFLKYCAKSIVMPGRIRAWIRKKLDRLKGGRQDTVTIRNPFKPGALSAELLDACTREKVIDPALADLVTVSVTASKAARARQDKGRANPELVRLTNNEFTLRDPKIDDLGHNQDFHFAVKDVAVAGDRATIELEMRHIGTARINFERQGAFFVSEPFGRRHFESESPYFAQGISRFQGHFVIRL